MESAGIFVISSKDVFQSEIYGNVYAVYHKESAVKAGVIFGGTSIQLTVPSLGQWPIFLMGRDTKSEDWAITNDYISAKRIADSWGIESKEIVKLEPGTFVEIVEQESSVWKIRLTVRKSNLVPSTIISNMTEAISVVEEALTTAVSVIARSNRPVTLLLSGGVDSGLLCSMLAAQGADVVALSIRTPWGDELEGASTTAAHTGVKLTTLDLTRDELLLGIEKTLKWTQHADVEITLIQLLVTIAHNYASSQGRDLVTGMGSDLLNSVSETGMEASSKDQNLADRISAASATGLFQTNALGTAGDHLIHHPYWLASTISAQLAVDQKLKSDGGFEKFYLRKLAQRRLPEQIAFGFKTAIHQGSNLQQGLAESLAPRLLDSYINQLWATIIE